MQLRSRMMTEQHAFDSHLASARQWLHELMVVLELEADEAGQGLRALRSGLHAIRDRLPAAEVVDLAAQLPLLIRGIYYDGWKLTNDPGRIRNRAELIESVERELADKRLSPANVLSAVIELLTRHVSPGEIDDVVSTLPRSIAALWKGHPGEAPSTLPP